MSEFVPAAKVGDIPEGQAEVFNVDGWPVAVFHVAGEYFALDDRCPHMGAPLSLGDVRNGTVICDRHLWAFRLADGVCPETPHLKARTFDVRVRADQIEVRLPETD